MKKLFKDFLAEQAANVILKGFLSILLGIVFVLIGWYIHFRIEKYAGKEIEQSIIYISEPDSIEALGAKAGTAVKEVNEKAVRFLDAYKKAKDTE